MKITFFHTAFSLVLFLLAVSLMSSLLFFSSDVGLRYLQIKNLVEHDWQTFAIDYPAAFIDPNFEFVPLYDAYLVINHQIYLRITPYLPLLSSFFFKFLGIAGLAVIPVIGAIFTGWAVKNLVKLHNLPHPDIIFWLTIIATPILFYSLNNWDHTLGVAFSTWAVYFLVKGIKFDQRGSFLFGGLCLGVGLGQRPELYAFAIALGLSLWFVEEFNLSRAWIFIVGGIIGVLPIWALNYIWFGHPFGIVVGGSLFGHGKVEQYPFSPAFRSPTPRSTKVVSLLYQIDHSKPELTVLSLLFFLIGLYLLFYSLRRREINSMFYIGFPLFIAGIILNLTTNWGQPIRGFLSTFPLTPLSLILSNKREVLNRKTWQGYKLVIITVALFAAILLFIWPASGGRQWGSRYLLPLYPLMFYMAIFSYKQLKKNYGHHWQIRLKTILVVIILVSIFVQMMSIYTLHRMQNAQVAIRDMIDNLPAKFILTNAPYLQSEMVSIDNTFVYVADTGALVDAMTRLAKRDIFQVAVIPLAEVELPVPEKIPGYRVENISTLIYRLVPE